MYTHVYFNRHLSHGTTLYYSTTDATFPACCWAPMRPFRSATALGMDRDDEGVASIDDDLPSSGAQLVVQPEMRSVSRSSTWIGQKILDHSVLGSQ